MDPSIINRSVSASRGTGAMSLSRIYDLCFVPGRRGQLMRRWNCKGYSAFERQMSRETEGPYFATRELDERVMSREAPDPRAAAAHADLADRYEALAAVFGAKRLTELPADYL